LIKYQQACAKTMGVMLRQMIVAGAPDVPYTPVTRSVYFVTDADRVKIGITTDVSKRIQALETGYGKPLTVLGVIPGASVEDERGLHARFGRHRLLGEWFKADDEILDYVRNNTAAFAV
jgi:hypothetical protein